MHFKKIPDIIYQNTSNGKVLLDLYVPHTLGTGPLDIVVFFYGGGLEIGVKEDLESLASEFAASGVIFAVPNYRLFPNAKYPDFINDCARSVAWIQNNVHKYLSPDHATTKPRLFVGGHSAGGYIALMLALDQSFLLEAGVKTADIRGFICASGQPTTHFNVLGYRGDVPSEEVIDEASPIYHAHRNNGTTPLLVLCARSDIPGRLEQTELLKAALDENYCGFVDYNILENHDHGSYMGPSAGALNSELFSLSEKFMNRC